jgi:hypothetical protein
VGPSGGIHTTIVPPAAAASRSISHEIAAGIDAARIGVGARAAPGTHAIGSNIAHSPRVAAPGGLAAALAANSSVSGRA